MSEEWILGICTGVTIFLLVIAIFYFIRQYIKGAQFKENVDGSGLVAIVTGASSGIGRQLTRELNLRNVKVYMLCRDVEKGQRVVQELSRKFGCDSARMIVLYCDLTKLETVRRAVNEFNGLESKLDILINNAGIVFYPKFEKTVDGFEMVWQSNYLSHFLLTELLLPKLDSAPAGRIINQSSFLHLKADSVSLEVVNSEAKYDQLYKTYANSKLAQVMQASWLSKKLKSSGKNVVINSCHPGVVDTDIVRIAFIRKFLRHVFAPFVWFLMKTDRDGAQVALYLALSQQINDVTGKYFSECKVAKMHPLASDDKACETLYNESLEACGLQVAV